MVDVRHDRPQLLMSNRVAMPPDSFTSATAQRRVATGVTTAFLGDERSLREFVVGDLVKTTIEGKGGQAALYLFNDSYDPLNYRQLRVAVNKDETLLTRFEEYCGRPISEIPDPFGCHEHYSRHFEHALLARLSTLDIHPTVVDSYQAYRSGVYANLVAATFERYSEIRDRLAEAYGGHMANDLFRAQCPTCRRLDDTHIQRVDRGVVDFTCGRCGASSRVPTAEIRGKLSWKLDCAARWNMYGVDVETFSKAHVAELGSVPIARFVSQHYYGGKRPSVIRYGDVKISRDLSFQLLDILPPTMLKTLFATHLTRDLHLTKESVETFCRKFSVRAGVSYVDFVRTELPLQALCDDTVAADGALAGSSDMKALVPYANRFSTLFYRKTYQVRLPTPTMIASADHATAQMAHRVIHHSLSLRTDRGLNWRGVKALIKAYLSTQPKSPHLYHYLRTLFGQTDGPNITTLLAILPRDYLIDIGAQLASFSEDGHRKLAA